VIRWLQAHVWIVPVFVMALAAAIRFVNLSYPSESLIFDEVYYVKDAASQLIFGYPTSWPDDLEYRFGPAELARVSPEASYAVHPPLGKWLIGLGLILFGSDVAIGWRFAAALFGTLTVGLVMLVMHRLTRSVWVASLAGFLLAIEGVSVVMSRVSVLDGFLAFFALLGVLFMILDHDWVTRHWLSRIRAQAAHRHAAFTDRVQWWRPWLLAAAVTFGLATAIKWSGLYFFAAFALFVMVRDALIRRRFGVSRWALRGFLQGTVNALLAIPIFIAAYLITWIGWIIRPGGWNRDWALTEPAERAWGWLPDWMPSLWFYHVDVLTWHSSLQAAHPYLAHPLSWPLALRPTSMLFESALQGEDGCPWRQCVWVISPIPNVLIWWGAIAAIVWLLIWIIRRIRAGRPAPRFSPQAYRVDRVALFAVIGFTAGYLPWLLTLGRSAVFQFYTVTFAPFLVMALTIVIWRMLATADHAGGHVRTSRRWVVGVFLGAVVIVSAYFMPLWIGIQTSYEFWNLHMWLPGWR